jgi:hypothetical protein
VQSCKQEQDDLSTLLNSIASFGSMHDGNRSLPCGSTVDGIDIGGFAFLEHSHSVAAARLIGRVVLDICHYNYVFPMATPLAMGSQTLVEDTAVLQKH